MKNLEFELNFNSTQKRLSRWKIFFFTFAVVFLMTTLQNMGIKVFNFSGSPASKSDPFKNVIPKIDNNPNTFKIDKPISLVTSSYASSYNFDDAKAYIAIDYNTGQVILEKNMSERFPIASLTKIMTSVVSLDLAKPGDTLTISSGSESEIPTTIGVVPGQKMTVEELLNGALLTSANDAAQALGDGINTKYGGNVFVGAMNEKAKYLKLSNTRFSNPQGFDSKANYSSVEDLAILTHYALANYPLISDIVKKDYQFLSANNNHKQFDLYNWNGLLDVYPGIEGVKIGNTDDAGYTTVVVSKRENQKVLAVLIGAPGVLERDLWASQLLDAAFQKTSQLPPVHISESDLRQKYATWKYWR